MVSRIDHIGIAVEDLDAAIASYQVLGLTVEAIEDVDEQGVRVAVFQCGESRLELLHSTDPEGPVARFLQKRGPGLHHVALQVDDLAGKLSELRTEGARLIDETPRRGAGGAAIGFVHPSSASGVLIELCQR